MAALVAVAGCISYRGGAQSLDPDRLHTEAGWIVAAPTPALRQQGSHDCGAASLAMIAGRWHVALSVDGAVAALPVAGVQGVRLGELRDAARAHGLTAFAIAGDRTTLVHELREGRPVIVGLLLPYGNKRVQRHYEVIVAVHPADDQFVTIDPATRMAGSELAGSRRRVAPGGAADADRARTHRRTRAPSVSGRAVSRALT